VQQRTRLTIIVPVREGSLEPRIFSCLRQLPQWNGIVEVLTPCGSAPSFQRNSAAKQAKGEYIYFLDDDCVVGEDALETGLSILDDSREIAVTGGPALTRPEAGVMETAIGDAMGSFIGSIMTRSRHSPVGHARRAGGEEFTLCNLMIRKEVYLALTGLNGNLHPGEDPEFLKRINSRGYASYYNPDMQVYRSRRQTFRALALQFYRYGVGRAQHIFQGIRLIDLAFFVPSLFLIGLPALFLFRSPALYFLYALYAFLCMAAGGKSAITRRCFRHLWLVPLALFTMHASYGAGFIAGLIRPRL